MALPGSNIASPERTLCRMSSGSWKCSLLTCQCAKDSTCADHPDVCICIARFQLVSQVRTG